MGNKIDRLEAELERVEDALDRAAEGRSRLLMAANRLAFGDPDAAELRRAVDLSGPTVLRLNRRREGAAMELEREREIERERVAAEEARDAKREQARVKRVERRRERVERTVRTMWDRSPLDIWDWPSAAPAMIREAILIDQAYCPEAWK